MSERLDAALYLMVDWVNSMEFHRDQIVSITAHEMKLNQIVVTCFYWNMPGELDSEKLGQVKILGIKTNQSWADITIYERL